MDTIKAVPKIKEALDWIAEDITRPENESVWPQLRAIEPERSRRREHAPTTDSARFWKAPDFTARSSSRMRMAMASSTTGRPGLGRERHSAGGVRHAAPSSRRFPQLLAHDIADQFAE